MSKNGTEGGEPITVFVVDDHDVVRKGLRFYLSAHPEITLVGEAGDTQSAVEGVAEHVPDVVLMDLVMPGMDGAAATRAIRERCP